MTIFLAIIISASSYFAFSRKEIIYKYSFNAYQIVQRKQWYRMLSHGFLHANLEHLIVNMFVFWSFGTALEQYYKQVFGSSWFVYYLLLFFGAIVLSSVYSLIKHKDNYQYNAVGASGAVSAVVFSAIFFNPWEKKYLFLIIPIPGILFAGLYLAYSYYFSKKKIDNIGHDAHFWGAVYGLVFPIIAEPRLFEYFISQLFKLN